VSGFGEGPADPFTKFWTDMAQKMAPGAMGNMGMPGAMGAQVGAAFPGAEAAQEATVKAMRKAFFDAWAQQCDEFMRSDAFLEGMKQSMDSALAFREQVNKFMGQAMKDSPLPTREDTDSILQGLRGFEERVLDQIEALAERVGRLEAKAGGSSSRRTGTTKGGKS